MGDWPAGTPPEVAKYLATRSVEELDLICKAAGKAKADNAFAKIPDTLKTALLRKLDRLEEGQTTSIVVKPEIRFTFNLTRNRDYTDIEPTVELLNPDDAQAKAFFDVYEIATNYFDDPNYQYSKLCPHLVVLEEEEQNAYKSWETARHQLAKEFGVNAWILVEQLRKEGVSVDS